MANKKEEVLAALEAKIGSRDRYGNWTFKGKFRTYRIKVQATSLRFERKWVFSDGSSMWHNLSSKSHYFKDINVEEVAAYAEKLKKLSNKEEKK